MLPAQVMPYEIVDVYPKVIGFIDTIRIDRGSRVHAGEWIIRLSAPELVAQRTQSEAGLHSAEAQLAAAQAKLASDHGTLLHLTAAAKTPGVVAGNDILVAEQRQLLTMRKSTLLPTMCRRHAIAYVA
jgi:membrane fusion protein, multidrug efflux system